MSKLWWKRHLRNIKQSVKIVKSETKIQEADAIVSNKTIIYVKQNLGNGKYRQIYLGFCFTYIIVLFDTIASASCIFVSDLTILTDCFIFLSCLFHHNLLILISFYTYYTDRHTTFVIVSHYTYFTLTLQLLYFYTIPLLLSSCTINSFHFYNLHSGVAEHLSSSIF